MKMKLYAIIAATLLVSCNGGEISNVNVDSSKDIISNESESTSLSSIDRSVLKEVININKYYELEWLGSNSTKTKDYFDGIICWVSDYSLPSFCLAGDSLVMKYYGGIYVYQLVSGIITDYVLEGEIVSIEYFSAEVKKVDYQKIFNEESNKYVYLVDNVMFDYILLDKMYNISIINNFEGCDEVYASYYEGVPQAIYSFNPLI